MLEEIGPAIRESDLSTREEGLESAAAPLDRFTSMADVVDAVGVQPAQSAPFKQLLL